MVHDDVSAVVVAQLLYLEAQSVEKPIQLYINSPGGRHRRLAIYDTMQYIRPPVATLCVGHFAAGRGGRAGDAPRGSNARIMIHQPSGGVSGQATDIEIHAREIIALRERLVSLYADHTGQPEDKIAAAKERDNFMSPDQARDFGLIDEVVSARRRRPGGRVRGGAEGGLVSEAQI